MNMNSEHDEERVLIFHKIHHVENKNMLPQEEGPPSVSWGKPSVVPGGSFWHNRRCL